MRFDGALLEPKVGRDRHQFMAQRADDIVCQTSQFRGDLRRVALLASADGAHHVCGEQLHGLGPRRLGLLEQRGFQPAELVVAPLERAQPPLMLAAQVGGDHGQAQGGGHERDEHWYPDQDSRVLDEAQRDVGVPLGDGGRGGSDREHEQRDPGSQP